MRRIKRPKDKSELFTQLTDRDAGGVFKSDVDTMIFAAALGAWKGRSVPFEGSKEPMVFELFAKQSDREALFFALGIHKAEGLELLSEENSDDLITAFEEYANGGLELIQSELDRTGQKPEDVVLNLLKEAEDQNAADEPQLSQLAQDLGL